MALSALIGPVAGLVKTWLTGKQQKAEAKNERQAELIRQAGSWEETMAHGSTTSWKDEWFTVVLSIPLILCFFPFAVPHVTAGFAALATMPEWYFYLLSVAVAASFGVRSVVGAIKGKGVKK